MVFLTENKDKISGEKIVILALAIADYTRILCINIPIIAREYAAMSGEMLRKTCINQVEYVF